MKSSSTKAKSHSPTPRVCSPASSVCTSKDTRWTRRGWEMQCSTDVYQWWLPTTMICHLLTFSTGANSQLWFLISTYHCWRKPWNKSHLHNMQECINMFCKSGSISNGILLQWSLMHSTWWCMSCGFEDTLWEILCSNTISLSLICICTYYFHLRVLHPSMLNQNSLRASSQQAQSVLICLSIVEASIV